MHGWFCLIHPIRWKSWKKKLECPLCLVCKWCCAPEICRPLHESRYQNLTCNNLSSVWSFIIIKMYLLPPANEVWGKVTFSEACVKNSVHKGWGSGPKGVPGPGGAWSWGGVSTTKGEVEGGLVQPHTQGGSWGGTGQAPPQGYCCAVVRILLECILVLIKYIQ